MTRKVLMRSLGLVGTSPDDLGPAMWFVSQDVDAFAGLGSIKWTCDKAVAKRFDDVEQALAEWKRQSSVRPLRPDGKPNRPCTAYSITFDFEEEQL